MGSFLVDLLEFVALALFLRAMAKSLGSVFRSSHINLRTSRGAAPVSPSAAPHRGEMARDPVCGMFVSTELSQQLRRGSETLHFCSRECLDKFKKGNEDFAS